MKHYLLALAPMLLQGCATKSDATKSEIYLPDGSVGYNISCDGSALSSSECYNKAAEICKEKGYILIAKDREAHDVGVSNGSANVSDAGGGAEYISHQGADISRNIYIKCKKQRKHPGSRY